MALLLREINKYKIISQTMAQIIRCDAGMFASLYVSQKQYCSMYQTYASNLSEVHMTRDSIGAATWRVQRAVKWQCVLKKCPNFRPLYAYFLESRSSKLKRLKCSFYSEVHTQIVLIYFGKFIVKICIAAKNRETNITSPLFRFRGIG